MRWLALTSMQFLSIKEEKKVLAHIEMYCIYIDYTFLQIVIEMAKEDNNLIKCLFMSDDAYFDLTKM